MELIKPEPLVIGGRAHYTLSSYEPVTITVPVHDLTDKDVDDSVRAAIAQMGGGPERLNDDAWIRDHFDGLHGAAELRSVMREELEAANQDVTERQKAAACSSELAKRLEQRVPRESIAEARRSIEQNFQMMLAQQGLSLDLFLTQSGMRKADLDAAFDEQASDAAHQQAAVSAWAQKRGVTVTDDEIPQMLGLPPEEVDQFMKNASAGGQLDQMRETLVDAKALRMIVDECSCTYAHDGASGNEPPHLKLV